MVTVRLWLLRCVQLEEERDRLEGDKLELAARYEQFSTEHVSAVEQTRTCSTRRGA